MKYALFLTLVFTVFLFFVFKPRHQVPTSDYDVYQYVKECKSELGINYKLPQLSCLDGKQIPIYVDNLEIQKDNWKQLSKTKKCDNPHWLGGDMGCWTYSHLQVLKLDKENIMVLNCRQKGSQFKKNWFRNTHTNLGLNQKQRKSRYQRVSGLQKSEYYYLYNTFNDIGIILRNTKTGKSCYLTQYGDAVAGFLPPLDEPLPGKDKFLKSINPDQARPPKNFPQHLWYRDANKAFKSPSITASAGCIDCHNAHGFKYSPHINSTHGIPDIYTMTQLPMLLVGKPYEDHYRKAKILQVTTEPIDGEKQLCTQCHKMTTLGTCGNSIDLVTGHPSKSLFTWLTDNASFSWMPPGKVNYSLVKKHIAAMKCCCENPHAKGCKFRKFGPTRADLPKGFGDGKGWIKGQGTGLCQSIIESAQWNAEKH